MHMIALSYNSAKIQHLKTVVDELMRLYGVMNGSSWKFILNSEDCERRHQMRRTEWYTDIPYRYRYDRYGMVSLPCHDGRNDDITISVD